MKQKKRIVLAAVLLCLLAVGMLFGVYVGDYYHADAAAGAALLSDDRVTVTQENGSWVFAPDTPTISTEDQQRQTADALAAWMIQ